MKRVCLLFLIASLALSLSACGGFGGQLMDEIKMLLTPGDWEIGDAMADWDPDSYLQQLEEDKNEQTEEPYYADQTDPYGNDSGQGNMDQAEQQTTQQTQGEMTQLLYWIENCDKLYLSDSDLYGLSKEECRIARNAIYAKSGRMFNSQELKDYFSDFNWYRPTVTPESFTEYMLNDVQLHNLNVVTDYERRCGY